MGSERARKRDAGTADTTPAPRTSMKPTTRRPATRTEKSLERKAKASNAKRKAILEQNKKNRPKGKKQVDPDAVKPSIWERMAEDRLYHIYLEMGIPRKRIDKAQRKRVFMSLLIAALGILAGMFMHKWLYMSAPIAGFGFYKMQMKKTETQYRAWKFERQLNFSKFSRLVIPYLKASGGSTALYTIFNKILARTENPDDRRSLYQLMGEMGDSPQDLTPFTSFAERSSGTDMSHLFMSTIFDFQQSTFDTSVIDELGQMAAEDMMNAIDEIIAMKLRRFVMFPTKVVMCSFILVVGLGAGLMVHNFKDLDFSGINANPVEDAQGAVEGSDKPAESTETNKETDTKDKATDAPTETSWQDDIDAIAASKDGQAEKLSKTATLAAAYEPSKSDLTAFQTSLQKEYLSGLYVNAATNEPYTLGMHFKAAVIAKYYEDRGELSEPYLALATGVRDNTGLVFGGEKPDSPTVVALETTVDAALLSINGACAVKGSEASMTYATRETPEAYKAIDTASPGNQLFCTTRQAERAGFKPVKE